MTRWTFSRVASPTFDDRLITRETVRFETPDSWATLLIVDGCLFSPLIASTSEVPAHPQEVLAARVVYLADQVHRPVAGRVQPLRLVGEIDAFQGQREAPVEVPEGAHVPTDRAGRGLGDVGVLSEVVGDVVVPVVHRYARAPPWRFVEEGGVPGVVRHPGQRHRDDLAAAGHLGLGVDIGVVAVEPEVAPEAGQAFEALLVRDLEALQLRTLGVGGGAVGPDQARIQQLRLRREDGGHGGTVLRT